MESLKLKSKSNKKIFKKAFYYAEVKFNQISTGIKFIYH